MWAGYLVFSGPWGGEAERESEDEFPPVHPRLAPAPPWKSGGLRAPALAKGPDCCLTLGHAGGHAGPGRGRRVACLSLRKRTFSKNCRLPLFKNKMIMLIPPLPLSPHLEFLHPSALPATSQFCQHRYGSPCFIFACCLHGRCCCLLKTSDVQVLVGFLDRTACRAQPGVLWWMGCWAGAPEIWVQIPVQLWKGRPGLILGNHSLRWKQLDNKEKHSRGLLATTKKVAAAHDDGEQGTRLTPDPEPSVALLFCGFLHCRPVHVPLSAPPSLGHVASTQMPSFQKWVTLPSLHLRGRRV